MPSEFELIEQYFTQAGLVPDPQHPHLILGIGDDCALLDFSQVQLAISVDTLVSGVHFPEEIDPFWIGVRSLAVNVSDLAAMGATPQFFTLALTLPWADAEWLQHFSQGLLQASQYYGIYLVGGDTTRGPLSITIQVMGTVDKTCVLKRGGAQIGDKIYVSGTLGDAAAGLAIIQEALFASPDETDYLLNRFYQPTARVELGNALLGVASSCLDISDGLLADLQHILTASHVGALVYSEQLPLSEPLLRTVDKTTATQWALSHGDDYELCFTVPVDKESRLQAIREKCTVPITCIGQIVKNTELRCVDSHRNLIDLAVAGYRHF